MKSYSRSQSWTATLALLIGLGNLSVWADPDRVPGNRPSPHERGQVSERQQHDDDDERGGRNAKSRPSKGSHYGERERYDRHPMDGLRFSDSDRRFIRDYYGAQWQRGRCPPGLAKKNNGCMPPGQVKAWAVGQPLGLQVQRYPLPPEVLIRLPIPPAGHEFVRVASDILLIAVGTSMVIDAIEDLGR